MGSVTGTTPFKAVLGPIPTPASAKVTSSALPQIPATMVFTQALGTQLLSSLKVGAEETLPPTVASVRDLRTTPESLNATNDFMQMAVPLPAFLE